MGVRLGELMVHKGLLSEDERNAILEAQLESGRPFGLLAEQMFGVSPRDVEQIWAEQFAELAEKIDPCTSSAAPEALACIERRQAWQFRTVPMRFEGSELVIATDAASLPRAMRFVGWRIARPCRFVLADPDALSMALQTYYPMAGLDSRTLAELTRDVSR
ncbi:MAG: hypothetical protein D6695_01250 [Planctomycetota bacterium]|nr:MAG: hypothetical protein D6695_01250 [Planctomycetota bacterium]